MRLSSSDMGHYAIVSVLCKAISEKFRQNQMSLGVRQRQINQRNLEKDPFS
jgi:hypothetical protein